MLLPPGCTRSGTGNGAGRGRTAGGRGAAGPGPPAALGRPNFDQLARGGREPGPPPSPAALGCASGGAGRRRAHSAEKAATKERSLAPPKPGFCSPLPGSAALPPPSAPPAIRPPRPAPPPLPRASAPLHPSAAASGRPDRPCPRPGAIRRRQLRLPRCRPPGHRPRSAGGEGEGAAARGVCAAQPPPPLPGTPAQERPPPRRTAPTARLSRFGPLCPAVAARRTLSSRPPPTSRRFLFPPKIHPPRQTTRTAQELAPGRGERGAPRRAAGRCLPLPPSAFPAGGLRAAVIAAFPPSRRTPGSAAGPAAHLAARARDRVRPAGACGRRLGTSPASFLSFLVVTQHLRFICHPAPART